MPDTTYNQCVDIIAKVVAFPKDKPEEVGFLWDKLLIEDERESCRFIARAVLSVIAEATKSPTSAMLAEWQFVKFGTGYEEWTAMHDKSPLWPEN